MHRKTRLFGALIGGVALFFMTGAPSNASTTMTVSCTPATHSSYSSCQGFQDYGNTVKPNVVTTHNPPGWEIARSVGTSVITPIPNNGDTVGTVDGYGDLFNDGCGNPTHTTYTVKWVSPVSGTAPSGTVAQMQAKATVFGTITINVDIYVIWRSSGDSDDASPHYDTQVTMPSSFYCANEPMQSTNTIDGTVSGTTRVIQRTPTTAGTYRFDNTWTDTNGGNHSDNASITIN
jgi:hypothetical protein